MTVESCLPALAPLLGVVTDTTSLAELRAQAPQGLDVVQAALREALLCALVGLRTEAELSLSAVASHRRPDGDASAELAVAWVMLELGFHARAAAALERGDLLLGSSQAPQVRALSQALHSWLLRDTGNLEPAIAAARVASQPIDELDSRLSCLIHIVSAQTLVHAFDPAEPLREVQAWGLLEVRRRLVRAEAHLRSDGAGPVAAREELRPAISFADRFGAGRDLAMAYKLYADSYLVDAPDQVPVWLGKAQQLFVRSGHWADRQYMRRAFRAYGRRHLDQVLPREIFEAINVVEVSKARLDDLLGAQRDARAYARWPVDISLPSDRSIDQSREALHAAETRLIDALEALTLERHQLSELVTLCKDMAGLDDPSAMYRVLAHASSKTFRLQACGLYELSRPDCPQLLAAEGEPFTLNPEQVSLLSRALAEGRALRLTGAQGVHHDAVPLLDATRPMALLLRRKGRHAELRPHERQQLAMVGTLGGTALSRAEASAALRKARDRDAATFAAIRDGIVSIDQDGRVTAMNDAAAAMLRVDRSRCIDRKLQDVDELAPLAKVSPATDELMSLPQCDVLVRSQRFAGGSVMSLQELASAQRMAHRLVGFRPRYSFDDLHGESAAFRACVETARKAAQNDANILITGESGTGKEMLAQAIHNASSRRNAPFVGFNVAAVPRELLESELFGYERGAFTGARANGNPGKFELAENGTLLLDEIGDMPPDMQVKILRVLQERTVQRLGGVRALPVRARFIATTHRDLETAIARNEFRLDLFHRLRVIHLRIPPLRERKEEIPRLVDRHLDLYAKRVGRTRLTVSDRVMQQLQGHAWPGNVRELANLLEGAASLLAKDQHVIDELHVPLSAKTAEPVKLVVSERTEEPIIPLHVLERAAILRALEKCDGNVAAAARALGISKGTLYNRIKEYGPDARAGTQDLDVIFKN